MLNVYTHIFLYVFSCPLFKCCLFYSIEKKKTTKDESAFKDDSKKKSKSSSSVSSGPKLDATKWVTFQCAYYTKIFLIFTFLHNLHGHLVCFPWSNFTWSAILIWGVPVITSDQITIWLDWIDSRIDANPYTVICIQALLNRSTTLCGRKNVPVAHCKYGGNVNWVGGTRHVNDCMVE